MLDPDSWLACRKRLNKTFAHMRERISGKLGNRNDNAFKLRKFFAMYDTQRTGKVAPLRQSSAIVQAFLHKPLFSTSVG